MTGFNWLRIPAILLLLSLAAAQVDLTVSNLPIVIIDTYGVEIPDEPKIPAWMGVIDNGPDQLNHIEDPWNNYDGNIGIEIRGSSSQMFPKKNFGFETRTSSGDNLNVPLMGLPSENDWVLHGPYSDKSLIRNVLIMEIARELGWYASRTRLCEVVLNDEYWGVYVLMEKIKRDGDRVDIERLEPEDNEGDALTGGYIVKVDKVEGDQTDGWYSAFPPLPDSWQSVYYQYHYPDEDDITPSQVGYIQWYINEFETVMDSDAYNDPLSGFPAILNVPSAIDFLILNEVSKNVDGYRLSSFMSKDRDSNGGALTMGPIWDYNLAFGNADYCEGGLTSGWQLDFPCPDDGFQIPFWWQTLADDPDFMNAAGCRWETLRETTLHESMLLDTIDSLTQSLSAARFRNFLRWPILGEYVWPNQFVGNSYEEEIQYLELWIINRLNWLDAQFSCEQSENLVITEIQYHASAGFPSGDWIEITNGSDGTVNLSGWQLKDGNNRNYFTISQYRILGPGSTLVFCKNTGDFSDVYPDVTNIIGDFNFSFSNGGESVRLYNPYGQLIDEVVYDDELPWPLLADGEGPSLELWDCAVDNNLSSSWMASAVVGGTPGLPNSVAGLLPGDLNGDSAVTVNDIVLTIMYIIGDGELTPVQLVVADLVADGSVDVLDIVQTVAMILES